jgi:hypothetical protein
MSEPLRLSAGGDPITRRLLQAARAERPRETARAEAITAAVKVAASGATMRVSLRQLWGRWFLLALAAGAGGAALGTRWVASGVVRELAPEEIAVEHSALDVAPLVPESFTFPVERPRQEARSRSEQEAKPAAPPTELELLRRARIELATGDPSGALVTLAEHEQAYPSGALREEAAALRVEALARAGDGPAARAAAARFGKTYPTSAYGERVRSVAASAVDADR